MWPRSGWIEGRCFRGRGTVTGSGTIGCAHVGRGWREGNWTGAKSTEAERRSRAHRIVAHRIEASMPSWRTAPTLARRRHGGGNTSHSHRFLRPYSNSQLPHRCGPSVWGGGSAKEIRVHSHTPHNIIPSVSSPLEITGEFLYSINRSEGGNGTCVTRQGFVDMCETTGKQIVCGGRLCNRPRPKSRKARFFFLSLGTDKN